MTSVAIYARVSSARQKKDQTIGSQTAALRAHAAEKRLELPEEWVFEDEGHSGAGPRRLPGSPGLIMRCRRGSGRGCVRCGLGGRRRC
jgi:DNA invertase Pin-like site-specific DNA recombinase